MKRQLLLVPAALSGVLLAACGQSPAAQSPTTTTTNSPPATTATTSAATTTAEATTTEKSTEDGKPTVDPALKPIDCGEIKVPGGKHRLIALPTVGGQVGCTEAFNVIDEYLNLPPEKLAEGSLGNVEVSNGWSCTTDDGVTASVGCVKGKVGDEFEFAFNTKP